MKIAHKKIPEIGEIWKDSGTLNNSNGYQYFLILSNAKRCAFHDPEVSQEYLFYYDILYDNGTKIEASYWTGNTNTNLKPNWEFVKRLTSEELDFLLESLNG